MKTDIQIAQEATMEPIVKVARQLNVRRMTLNFTENTKQNYPMN